MADALRAPRQDRSRDKLERIYQAAVALLVEGGWDAVTVGDVERRSGVSRGTFYLRFPHREALLDYVAQRLIDTVNQAHDEAFSEARAVGATTLDAAVRAAVRATAGLFRRHGPVLLRLNRGERGGAGAEAMNRLSRDFRSVLAPVTGADPARRAPLEFAMQLVLSMVNSEIHPRVTFTEHVARDWDAFVDELGDAVTCYLRSRIPGA
ncbi:AcrR family transcriptional regulator [Catenuloplanes nepalensis]|uniref:AcrR family transcriptional regulator n=1 Tax=Catenuloplanes nepalensis TaxID=587533 RepID=A0ABT9MNJ8_9ACTN|nr:TetR/AcrR family transcriptional regulator [Catenuloplanes nepalensis]MDP9793027.1 AcrR family transcriptional regulator [Catenuloplanes nepalensis]